MDPELDPVSETRSESEGRPLPGPLTLPRLVAGVHVVAALAFLPFAWIAYRDGGLFQAAPFAVLVVLLLIAAVVTGRITASRY